MKTGRVWTEACTSQGTPKIASNPLEARRGMEQFLLQSLPKEETLLTL